MIHRLTGQLVAVDDSAAVVEVGGVAYELYIPQTTAAEIAAQRGGTVTLHTFYYMEGNPTVGSILPRLAGFRSESDRAFFLLLNRVRGVSVRKALRAMSIPAAQFARAIEDGDVATLSALPEIGRKTAALIISELRGKLEPFLLAAPAAAPVRELTDAQRIALDILVQWGDRRADAQRWIAAAVEENPSLNGPDEIVRAAYRAKQRA